MTARAGAEPRAAIVDDEGLFLTPRAVRTLGVGQFVFAAFFVLWLLILDRGPTFAWPVTPRLTAVFLGTSFILRTFLGLQIIRTRHWYKLRWVVWGNYTFLAVILLSTFWHAEAMNWEANILLAHVWIIIYIFEPLVLPFLGPYAAEAKAPLPAHLQAGPILPGLQRVLVALVMVCVAIAGLYVINPAFITTRWPWPLDPFNARIMAAWPAAIAVWAGTIYFARDWAEVKVAIQGLSIYAAALFVAWIVFFPLIDRTRPNVFTYGGFVGLSALVLLYYYWRQEQQAKNWQA